MPNNPTYRNYSAVMPARSATAVALASNLAAHTIAWNADTSKLTIDGVDMAGATATVVAVLRAVMAAAYVSAGTSAPANSILDAALASACATYFGGRPDTLDDR